MGNYDDSLWDIGNDRNTALTRPRASNVHTIPSSVNALFSQITEQSKKAKKRSKKVHIYSGDNSSSEVVASPKHSERRSPLKEIDLNQNQSPLKNNSISKQNDSITTGNTDSEVRRHNDSSDSFPKLSPHDKFVIHELEKNNTRQNIELIDLDKLSSSPTHEHTNLVETKPGGIPISFLVDPVDSSPNEPTVSEQAKAIEEDSDDEVILVGQNSRPESLTKSSSNSADEAVTDSEEEPELLKTSQIWEPRIAPQQIMNHSLPPASSQAASQSNVEFEDVCSQLSTCNFQGADQTTSAGGEEAEYDEYYHSPNAMTQDMAVPDYSQIISHDALSGPEEGDSDLEEIRPEEESSEHETTNAERNDSSESLAPSSTELQPTVNKSTQQVDLVEIDNGDASPSVDHQVSKESIETEVSSSVEIPKNTNRIQSTPQSNTKRRKGGASLAEICGKTNFARHSGRVGLSKRVKVDSLHGYLGKK